jgi:hypothetical protein
MAPHDKDLFDLVKFLTRTCTSPSYDAQLPLLVTHEHFYREAQHALPELTFRSDDEVKIARARRPPSSDDGVLHELNSLLPQQKKLTKTLRYFQDRL